jgi:DNA-directed RNA polymerase specialized sigma24 family protein
MPSPSFQETRWSLVLATRGRDEPGRQALRDLCEAYWRPLVVLRRREGRSEEEALEDVQGFLVTMLEAGDGAPGTEHRSGPLDGADPARGRFRAYLVGALRHYVSNEARAGRAARRGGGQKVVSLDAGAGTPLPSATALAREPSPEAAYARAFALEVLARATERLREEWASRGRSRAYEVLADTLDGAVRGASYAARATALGTTEGAVKVAVHRLRGRLAELVREEVAATVAGAEDVDAELQDLFAALGGTAESCESAAAL